MLIVALTIGGAATVIAIAALLARQTSTAQPERQKDSPFPSPPPDDPRKEDEKGEPAGDDRYNVIGKIKAEVGGIWSGMRDPKPEPEPEPEPPSGPDPYYPAPVPTPGQYYQVVKGDTLWDISKAAYNSGSKYDQIVAAEENRWMHAPWNTKWKGGLYQKYDGWNTSFGSGSQYGVIWIP